MGDYFPAHFRTFPPRNINNLAAPFPYVSAHFRNISAKENQ
jgi:hypothetical protein